MNQENDIWVLAGMTIEALLAFIMASSGLLALNALNQGTVAGFFLIVCFLFFGISLRPCMFFLGMAMQAFVTTVLSLAGLSLNPLQQFIAAGLYGVAIVVIAVLDLRRI